MFFSEGSQEAEIVPGRPGFPVPWLSRRMEGSVFNQVVVFKEEYRDRLRGPNTY